MLIPKLSSSSRICVRQRHLKQLCHELNLTGWSHTHPFFLSNQFERSETVCFAQHRHEVDLVMQSPHKLHVNRSETGETIIINRSYHEQLIWLFFFFFSISIIIFFLPVSVWWDEIEAAMHPVVLNVLAVQPTLVSEVLLKLMIDKIHYWLPATRRIKKQKKQWWLWLAIQHYDLYGQKFAHSWPLCAFFPDLVPVNFTVTSTLQ